MKKTKLLSFLLAGALLFHTTGIDALATASAEPLPAAETVQEPSEETSAPLPEEDGENQNPGEKEEAAPEPEVPGEGGEQDQKPETPGEGKDDKTLPGEEAPAPGTEETPEQPEEENTQPPAKEEVPAEEQDPEESVSENSVSENTVSENTLPEEEENALDIFPGLGDDYVMSSQQLADKRTLASYTSDIAAVNKYTGYYPDTEGLYELGKVICSASSESEAEQIAKAFGGTLESYAYDVAEIHLPEKATVAMAVVAAADPARKLPAVWPNYYEHLYTDTIAPAAIPSDPFYGTQWQHDYIGTTYAYAAGYRGEDIKVAVIDTGLQKNHPDLEANALDGKNFVGLKGENPTVPTLNTDNQTHGTHVAGIIAADDNSAGGMGIAPDAKVSGFCVFPADESEGAETLDIIRAINAAVSEQYDIINMSLGNPKYNDVYAKAIKNAYEKGVAVFAASGNEDTSANAFPASYPGAISVGAVDQNSARASFSNYGSTVKLAFPGVGIYSTVPGSSYGYMNGTSQASPAAAGTAAVILSARKDEFKTLKGKQRVDKLLALMKSSTTKCTSSGMGAGTTWLPGALKIATDATAPDMPEITVANEASYTKDKKGNYIAESVTVTLSTKTAVGVTIYYSTDGKKPALKNGAITNATRYTGGPIALSGAKKVTINAVALNPITGKMSKVASKSFNLAPLPTGVTVSSAGNVTRIAAGKSLKLTAAVTPSYTVSTKVNWSADAAAAAASVTVDKNGTVKTKATTPAGKYTVTATALDADGKPLPAVTASFALTVTDKAEIKKVAFIKDGKTYKAPALNVNGTLDLNPYLQVTKLDNSAGTAADVAWSTSNPKVATVENGVITAVAAGKATIKAISNDGGNKNASCSITVNQPVVSIAITGSAKVAAGKSITLNVVLNDNKAKPTNTKLNWTVTGNDNVTVTAAGKLTAKKEASGTCTVKATAADGSGISSEPYTITIVSGAISKISLSSANLTLFSPNAAKQNAKDAPTAKKLEATVTGTAGFDKTLITWSSSAPEIASVADGVVTAHTAGKAIITCAATDGSSQTAKCTVNVAVPMSKLAIGIADGWGTYNYEEDVYFGYIAAGKSIKMSAKYSSNYGVPTNKQVTWTSSNPDILTVDKTGKVTANKSAKVYSSAVITATAADGSGVTSNQYVLQVRPSFKRLTIEKGCVAVAWDNAGEGYTVPYFTLSVSGGKNPGINKVYNEKAECYVFLPVPGEVTVPANIPSSTTALPNKYARAMKITAKLSDGSGLKATRTVWAVRFADGTVKYHY